MTSEPAKDHWTPQSYNAAASFVHKLTSKVVASLAPGPTDHILDLGCGDGLLTAQIAESSASVLGLDASTNFIGHARAAYSGRRGLSFEVQDCSRLQSFAADPKHAGCYDKVFSNAALHWILRPRAGRLPTLRAIHGVLKPGGLFVFEMGGAGNVAEVHAAIVAGLVHAGVAVEAARESSPWFFPSEELMGRLLRDAGFEVETLELEYRPTRLEEGEGGGVKGWVRLMGAMMLDTVDEDRREGIVEEAAAVLEGICRREEGGYWLGYTRLRGVARKHVYLS